MAIVPESDNPKPIKLWRGRDPRELRPVLEYRDDARHSEAFGGQHPSSSLRAYWQMLKRRRLLLLLFTGTGVLLALLFSAVQHPAYRARTVLEIQDLNENFLNIQGQDPTASPSGSSAEAYVQTQISVLESRALLERVTEKLGMKATTPNRWWTKYLGILVKPSANDGNDGNDTKLLENVASHLRVQSIEDTHNVEILFDSNDPLLAANFSNTLVEEFTNQSRQMRWDATQSTSEWLTGHLGDLKQKLEAQETELQEYANSSGLILAADSGKDEQDVAGHKLLEIQEELAKAHEQRIQKQAAYELAQTEPTESLAQTLDDVTIRDYEAKLTELRRQLVDLSTTLTPENYRVREVQAQIAEMESALGKHQDDIVQRLENEYREARRREDLLTGSYSKQASVVSGKASKAIHYNSLKNELDTTSSLYDALLQRVKQAGLAAAMRASNVLIVDPAKPPLLPYRPNYRMNIAIGMLGGLILGLGFVVLRENSDRSIRVPGVAPVYLNLPELGVIPLIGARPFWSPSLISKNDRKDTLVGLSLPSNSRSGLVLGPAPRQKNASPIAEGFRSTLASILLAAANGNRPRLIVVTSPGPGDGKSTVVTNLGMAMAEIGWRVLLIDGDMRRPRLHEVFRVSNDKGLSDVLASKELALALFIQTPVAGLSLLTSGTSGNNLSSLLHSAQLMQLYVEARVEFDFVLVDAPPALPVSDARLLARDSDGVIVVIRAGQTTLETAQLVCQRFAEDGTLVLGTILNSWDVKKSPYGVGSEYDAIYQAYAGNGQA
jgi:succinoglycan biosynthesis transport protein ExoP